jgi:phage head maturation protease
MTSSWSLADLRKGDADGLRSVRISTDRKEVIARTGAALQLVEAPSDQAPGTSGMLEGTFARFNEWTEISDSNGRYLERISPGAFRKTINETGSRTPVLLDHGKSTVLGSLPLGRLQAVNETADGVNYTVRLNPGLPELLLAGLRDGQFGSSFRAQAIKSSVNRRPARSATNPDRLPEVTRTELRLLDVGPTSMPAYGATTAKVRSRLTEETPTEPERPSWFLGDLRGDEDEPYWALSKREGKHGRTYALAN